MSDALRAQFALVRGNRGWTPMKRLLLPLILMGCADGRPPPAIHALEPTPEGVMQACMAPDGGWIGEPQSATRHPCTAPNRFVFVSICSWGQRPAGESAGVRAEAARDQTLVGDNYSGAPICVPAAPY